MPGFFRDVFVFSSPVFLGLFNMACTATWLRVVWVMGLMRTNGGRGAFRKETRTKVFVARATQPMVHGNMCVPRNHLLVVINCCVCCATPDDDEIYGLAAFFFWSLEVGRSC